MQYNTGSTENLQSGLLVVDLTDPVPHTDENWRLSLAIFFIDLAQKTPSASSEPKTALGLNL